MSDNLAEIQKLISPAVLLPITPGTKAPSFSAWQKTTPADMARPEYLSRFGPRHNIGVLQGAPSNGLCSIDLDADEWIAPFLADNPKLANTLRTRRSRGCNLWVRITGEYPALQRLHHPTRTGPEGKPLDVGEWRSTGGQTVIAGEAEGVPYRFEVEARPIEIAFAEIVWPAFIADPPRMNGNGALPVVAQDGCKLDVGRLENVIHLDGGTIRAACPACRAAGGDHTGDHLRIDPSGRFGCAKYSGDHAHRKEIWKLAGTPQAIALSSPEGDTEFDFANRLAAALPPLKTCGNRWHAYRAGTWQEIERATLRPEAQNILPPAIRTERRGAALLDHLEGRSQTASDSFFGFHKITPAGDVLLNAGNGIVRVKTSGEVTLEAHAPEYLFTKRLAADFDPAADFSLFSRVMSEALSDPADQILLQLCAGNFLLPDCRFETALVCYGEAGRGKSTIAEPIAEALGWPLVPRLTMSQLCDPKSYHVPKLKHAAVNVSTELDAVELGESGPFKAVVSGEPIEARPIYGAPFTMQTTCKLWFLANCLPRFKHGTEAELRRTRFLRFDYLPPLKDVTLKARLASERNGVFRWMLAGLVELLNVALIPFGGRHSREVHNRFKISNDPVGAFVSACCLIDPAAKTAKDTLRDAFREFCEQHELPAGADVWFLRCLYERWPNLKEARPRGDEAQRRRVILGIEVKT